jgi:hypothetical protein
MEWMVTGRVELLLICFFLASAVPVGYTDIPGPSASVLPLQDWLFPVLAAFE